MKRNSRPVFLLTIFMISLLLAPTALFGIKPGPAWADDSGQDFFTKLPESSPGELTITWYSAKRYYQIKSLIGLFTSAGGIYDKAASTTAYNNYDRSVVWGTEKISDLSFNMGKWVKAKDEPKRETFDTWVWGEVKGYMKMPDSYQHYLMQLNPSPNTNAKYSLILGDPDKGIEYTDEDYFDNSTFCRPVSSKNEYVPFCLRIRCFNIDPSKTNNFSLKFGWVGYNSDWFQPSAWLPKGNITSYYSELALKDMQRFFKFDSANYCFTISP
ncbi:MAG TPA: hypothetical protein VHQ70_01705, partial [Syntrophomonadaceae bacterium]|nr:hypothetical protein [Syntrophomonadaceae bacterium]